MLDKLKDKQVLTVGHSRHGWEDFLDMLKRNRVSALVDVRTTPFSRFAAWSKRGDLEEALELEGIGYHFLGAELGGRPAGSHLYRADGTADYNRFRKEKRYQDGLSQLLALIAKGGTVCIMCAEANPEHCHRKLLIGADLQECGVRVRHVRAANK